MLSTATAPPPRSRKRKTSTGGSGSKQQRPYHTTTNRLVILTASVLCLGSLSVIPILILERLDQRHASVPGSSLTAGGGADSHHHSVEKVLDNHRLVVRQQQQQDLVAKKQPVAGNNKARRGIHMNDKIQHPLINMDHIHDLHEEHHDGKVLTPRDKVPMPKLSLSDLVPDTTDHVNRPVARGIAGLPLDKTPAVVGARRAHIEDCDVNVDSVAYWNDPQGDRDAAFQSPFAVRGDEEKFITFSSDRGGWNNVRMSMEIIFIIAAATNRTLVLPPKEPLYLLAKGTQRHKGFADFFPLESEKFQKKVRTITTSEFLERHGKPNGRYPLPVDDKQEAILAAAEFCDFRKEGGHSCFELRKFLDEKGTTVNISAVHSCVVFDESVYRQPPGNASTLDAAVLERLKAHCGTERELVYWQASQFDDPFVLHFRADDKHLRLLAHFYNMLFFTDPKVDNYFKRFVRDYLHYHSSLWCAAGKIVKALQVESTRRGFPPDEEGAGGYSALHVRRGDLQYKKVKIPAREWYNNTKEVWLKNELIYVATDERDKSFFDDFAVHHDLRFLDDYWDFANLSSLDSNFMGMIDTIVASRGRAFAGTWFSTFSGYINRMRGYHGLSMMDSWYSFLPKKNETHSWPIVDSPKYAYEWPDGWGEIDGDDFPSRTKF